MFERFHNREEELKYLEEEYRKQSFSLIIVYGRRRVGKTFLIKKFLENKSYAIYFYVSEMSSKALRSELAKIVYEKLNIRLSLDPTWEEIFRTLFKYAREKRVVVVLDEFQRLLEVDRSAITELQKIVDEESASSRIMIVCIGSSVGVME